MDTKRHHPYRRAVDALAAALLLAGFLCITLAVLSWPLILDALRARAMLP